MDKYDEEAGEPLLNNNAPEADLEKRDHRQIVRDRLKGLEAKAGIPAVLVKEIQIEEPSGIDCCLLYFFNAIYCLLFPIYLCASVQCLEPR